MKMGECDFRALMRVAERQIADADMDALVGESLYQLYAKLPPMLRNRPIAFNPTWRGCGATSCGGI